MKAKIAFNEVVTVEELEAERLAEVADFEQAWRAGQDMFCRIRPSSKYYGQGTDGALIKCRIDGLAYGYCVQIAGNQYRLTDVDLFVGQVQITSEK